MLLLVRDGRIVADGPKEALLTSETMSGLFGVPLEVVRTRDRYSLVDC